MSPTTTPPGAAPSTTRSPSDSPPKPPGTQAVTTTVTPAGSVADPLALAPGESLTFAVDVTVTESLLAAFTAGERIWHPNCYTLSADGTFDDPTFPDPSGPTPGTWRSTWDGVHAGFVAEIRADDLVLAFTGQFTGRWSGLSATPLVVEETLVDRDGTTLARLRASGAVSDGCRPER
jgi:hypothetical protein